jgi:pilus assembly protein CpaE
MKLPVVLIGENSNALTSLKKQLEKELDFLVDNKIHGFDESFQVLKAKTGPVLVIVDLSRNPENAFETAQDIKFKLHNVHLLMTSPDNSPETILRAMRSGAEEFLTQPLQWPDVLNALQMIRKKITLQSAKNAEQGRIVTVFSSKGGVGTTTVATNLAVALAADKRRSVCLVDLVLQFGSVTSFLNLEASYTIVDFVKNLKRIDPLFLDGSLVKHMSGVRVLAEPFHAEDAARIETADIDQTLEALVQAFNAVVIDTPKEFDETTFLALDKAHLILVVTEMDVPSLKSAHRALELFDRMGIYQKKIRLILNRHVKSKYMSLESVEQTLGLKVFWTLPNDYPTAIAALNQGLPILETEAKSEIAKSYWGLANAVAEGLHSSADHKMELESKKAGILGRWIPSLVAVRKGEL